MAFGSDDGLSLAVIAPLTFPTGSPASFRGNSSLTLEPKLALELGAASTGRLGVNAGYIVRQTSDELQGLVVG